MSGGSNSTLLAVLVAAASALAVATIGGTLTTIGPWYRHLVKPGWTPPDWAFPVVWTTIFALAAIAGVTAWRAAGSPGAGAPMGGEAVSGAKVTREWIIGLFALNGFLNILWSLLFFRLQRPDWAVWEAAVLWLSVAAIVAYLWHVSRLASVLMTPYLVWVGVAFALNLTIVRLNAPFG